MFNQPTAETLRGRDGSVHTVIPCLQEPERVTTGADDEQLLYFTSTSVSDDGADLVVIVSRGDTYDLAAYDLDTGRRRMLTAHKPGCLKSYVYFDGQPFRGFGRASVSFDPARKVLYYIHGRQIRRIDLAGGGYRVLAELPGDEVTAFTHVSGDGAQLCVPTTDARALADDVLRGPSMHTEIDATVQRENLRSYLNVFDTSTGALLARETVERGWVTHVQFQPNEANLVAFNHEWPGDCGIRRIWLWDRDAGVQRRMRDEAEGRSRADWTCHEMWERDGSSLIYHGGYRDGGPSYLGTVNPAQGRIVEVSLPGAYTPYGHFTTGAPGWLVTDGCFVGSGGNPAGNWISLVHVDWNAATVQWRPLCASGSSWRSQDAHPHPIFDHGSNYVYFSSDTSGSLAVYRADASSVWSIDK